MLKCCVAVCWHCGRRWNMWQAHWRILVELRPIQICIYFNVYVRVRSPLFLFVQPAQLSVHAYECERGLSVSIIFCLKFPPISHHYLFESTSAPRHSPPRHREGEKWRRGDGRTLCLLRTLLSVRNISKGFRTTTIQHACLLP